MNTLIVLADGAPVGELTVSVGRWSFAYAPDWVAFALAPGFPITQRRFDDGTTHKPVEWFFENLLPEGRLRELIARRDRIEANDTWALLRRHGRDTAGALSLLPTATDVPTEERFVPLPPDALQQKIQESRARQLPLMASWDELRMSLAGAQEKLGLYVDPEGRFFLPEGTAASTHIVKPDNASADFPYCPASEFFVMRLARELGLPVPDVDLHHLPEPLYVIHRFDRQSDTQANGHTHVRRLHQIDLCQALGVPPSRKYESEGGLGLSDLFDLLRTPFIERPIVAVNSTIQWVAFNYLVGNLDAHAKNVAFLMRRQKAVLAPFYDLLCVEAYLPRQTMAMSIAGENKPGWIEGAHWDALAYDGGVAPRLIRGILGRMSEALPHAVATVIGDTRLHTDEREFLRGKVLPVIDERRAFAAHALQSRPTTLAELFNRTELDPDFLDRLRSHHG